LRGKIKIKNTRSSFVLKHFCSHSWEQAGGPQGFPAGTRALPCAHPGEGEVTVLAGCIKCNLSAQIKCNRDHWEAGCARGLYGAECWRSAWDGAGISGVLACIHPRLSRALPCL